MKDKEAFIRDLVSHDDKILATIYDSPQSYNSILQHMKDCGTLQCILRRRIKRLLKEDTIWKMRVPGTRFGLVLFCIPEHKYKILISQGLAKVRIFYMFDVEDDEHHIVLKDYWELVGPNWSKWVFSDEILKIPKYTLRDGGFRLWE